MFTNGNCATNFTMPVMPANTGYGVPVMPAVAGFGGSGGYGNDFISLAVIAMILGWGGFGYGGFGSGGAALTNGDLQRGFDTQSIIGKLNGLENGMCSLGYDQLAQMNGINTNIAQTGYNLERAAQNNAIANMQAQYETMRAIDGNTTAGATNTGAIIAAVKDCCCDEQMRGMQAEYNAQTRARDITDTANTNTRVILEKLCQMENSAKDEKIAAQAQKITQLEFAASQAEQNETLKGWVASQVQRAIDTIHPQAGPAWIVPNPCGCNNFGYGGYYGGTAIA